MPLPTALQFLWLLLSLEVAIAVSMATSISRGRKAINYFELEPSDYTDLRRVVNQFAEL